MRLKEKNTLTNELTFKSLALTSFFDFAIILTINCIKKPKKIDPIKVLKNKIILSKLFIFLPPNKNI